MKKKWVQNENKHLETLTKILFRKYNIINLIWQEREKKYIKLNFSNSWIKTCCHFYKILNCMMWLIDYIIAMKKENYIYMNTSNYETFIALCVHHNIYIAKITSEKNYIKTDHVINM